MNKQLVIYIHGKGGNAAEAEHYKPLFAKSDVVGFDYKSQTPWEAKEEFPRLFDLYSKDYDSVILIANSIGAFFAMCSLSEKSILKAMFVSPVANMEKLILDMLKWAKSTEKELCRKKEIHTDFGETLYWQYLCYVRNNPIKWNIPTSVLYGENDNLTSFETISAFAEKTGASLMVMKNGEHWFHTAEQMKFLDNWIKENINCINNQKI